jgi:hypothetical protein
MMLVFSSGDDSTGERKREKGEKHVGEQSAETGELEGRENSISLAEECVKYFRRMNALEFDQFESLWDAPEAVRKANSERMAVRREMDSSERAAVDKDFGMYGYHCDNALMLLDNTRLHLKAKSVTARTTQGDVTAAERRLSEGPQCMVRV